MRLVLDTNVLVSASLKRVSTPALAVHLAQETGALLKSLDTERQVFEVLARPYFAGLIDAETQTWLRTLIAAAELITIAERIAACRDPTDDKFLELAVSGRADAIVSGDTDLLALHPFRNIPILSPAAFARSLRP